jgi:rhodanese-related sulfurtransferase
VLKLQELGFTNAYALLGGLGAYTKANLPTDPTPKELDAIHPAS